MRNRVRPREQRPADFSAGRIAMRMQDSRAAVGGLACKSQLRSRTIKFRTPFNEFRDVFRTFFHQQSHRFWTAQAIARIDGVLFVQSDLIFVERATAIPPCAHAVAESLRFDFRQNQDTSRSTQLDRRA